MGGVEREEASTANSVEVRIANERRQQSVRHRIISAHSKPWNPGMRSANKTGDPKAALHISCLIRVNPRKSAAKKLTLNVEVLHIQSIFFDELAPRLDILAHQRSENGLALGDVFELHRQQRAPFGIHGRLPQ